MLVRRSHGSALVQLTAFEKYGLISIIRCFAKFRSEALASAKESPCEPDQIRLTGTVRPTLRTNSDRNWYYKTPHTRVAETCASHQVVQHDENIM